MKWQHPPTIKIYEALGAVADGRIEIDGNSAKVYSSSGNKFYTVTYDPTSQSIMANDNASFYRGYLGYPSIAFLMVNGELPYSPSVGEKLKDIAWKDLNQKFKNDFDKTLSHILESKSEEDRREIRYEVAGVEQLLLLKPYNVLGEKVKPPEGY
ncbi:MAG TPA: hypothetical protein VF803_00190 [Candidatus Paceibacterota bacterium]